MMGGVFEDFSKPQFHVLVLMKSEEMFNPEEITHGLRFNRSE